jgi:hypothetical protein
MAMRLSKLLLLTSSLLLATSVLAAETQPGTGAVIVPPNNPQDPNLLMQLQLKEQELQLEQQILVIKQKLLQLQQLEVMKKQLTKSDTTWVSGTNGKVPDKAVVGAYANGKPLYICHADYLTNGTHPGQLTDKGCLITYGLHSYTQTNYQILTSGHTLTWKPSYALFRYPIAPFPLTASMQQSVMMFPMQNMPIPGGQEQGHPLYVCRAIYADQIHLGKVVANNCNIAVQDAEIRVPTFEVLFD